VSHSNWRKSARSSSWDRFLNSVEH
jgi:hypothetical protein